MHPLHTYTLVTAVAAAALVSTWFLLIPATVIVISMLSSGQVNSRGVVRRRGR